MVRAVVLVAVLVTGCTGSPRPQPQPPDLSPAPIECPTGIVHAATLPASELADRMKGHLPLSLPSGFGLAQAWAEGDGFLASATWADGTCREVTLTLSSHEFAPSGTKIGAWTLTTDAPGACGNAVLGDRARCLGYIANLQRGTLVVQMMGLTREEGDEIVLSIPLARS